MLRRQYILEVISEMVQQVILYCLAKGVRITEDALICHMLFVTLHPIQPSYSLVAEV